ncbi:Rsd/AlgQ family anti-sigma factor [Seongchinamella unica]|uniref:Rsd/AlgQ family anti-sigma factor n=1 Tax=Seongchinamella unica TaxID=2547392 RepID=A0A4R5LV20_9GAMM|nr:Rsd/AlgQ family anti-sigma factor [Seongchinamella unica]TDG15274.1 Rsd/AlgQ family anti-sigma factor [Seongchinamella unica]
MPHRNPEQQFNAVEELLTRWLKERREVLGKYTEIVVGMDGLLDQEALEKRQRLLCQLLVDYVSAGHFEVYHELLEEAESFADGSSSLAEKLMPAIGDTTEVILAYEEKYTSANCDGGKLKRDLSALGEVLESRFLLEDKLIAGLHNSHRRQQG